MVAEDRQSVRSKRTGAHVKHGGKAFAGWFVDAGRRGRGLGGLGISVLAEIARALDVRLFCSVSPRNAPSAAALKASAETRLLRTLDDGSELAEILP